MQVKWTTRGIMMFDNALYYSAETPGQQAAINFFRKTRHLEELLVLNPLMGKIEPVLARLKTKYRTIVIIKTYKMVYYVNEDNINIVAIWNCRQSNRAFARFINELK